MSKNDDALQIAKRLRNGTPSGVEHDIAAEHLERLTAENEAQDALLRQAVEAWDNEQSTRATIVAIRKHLEGRAS